MYALVQLLACGPADSVDGAPGAAVIRVTDAEQLHYEAAVDPSRVAVDASQEVRFDWRGLFEDVYGRPLGEEAVSEAWVFAPSDDEIGVLLDAMVNERLDMASLSVFATCIASDSSCLLRDFRLLDGAADVPERLAASGVAWGLVLVNPADGGLAGVYELAAGAPGAELNVQLTPTAPLSVRTEAGEAVVDVPAGEPALRVEWDAITVDAAGAPFEAGLVDELFIVHSALGADELPSHLLDLASVTDTRWGMPVGRHPAADLAALTGEEPFSGFDDTGTWWLGLSCSGCATPAPRLLTRVEVAR